MRKSVVVLLTVGAFLVLTGCGYVQSLQYVSVDSTGAQASGASDAAFISADGSVVAFQSDALLDVADTNGVQDIYVRAIDAAVTARASVSSLGTEANGESTFPSLSADGGRVAFLSAADNLVSPDLGGRIDAFVHAFASSETTIVSVATDGAQANRRASAPLISGDGNVVVFQSAATNLGPDANLTVDIFARDITAGTTTLVSIPSAGGFGNADSLSAYPSADGAIVAFASDADNMVAGDVNLSRDVFVRDIAAGTTTLVSRSTAGVQGNALSQNPALSADGRYVAFASDATNLVADDTNSVRDIFLHDRTEGTTIRVSITSAGAQSTVGATNPAISPDGRFVAFNTNAALMPDDTNVRSDVYVYNAVNGQVYRVSKSADNYPTPPLVEGDAASTMPSLSQHASRVAFETLATTLVTPDANIDSDIVVANVAWDSVAPTTTHDAPTVWVNTATTVTLTPVENRLPHETAFPGSPWGNIDQLVYTADGTTTYVLHSETPPSPFAPVPVTFSTEGVHTLDFFSVDEAENIEAEQSVTVSIDLTDPTASSDVQPSYTTSATITLAGADGLSGLAGLRYEVVPAATAGPPAFVDYAGPIQVNTVGSYRLSFYSVDNAGNESAVQTVQFTVAAAPVPPAPPVPSAPSGGGTSGNRIPWTGGYLIYIMIAAAVAGVTGFGLRLQAIKQR